MKIFDRRAVRAMVFLALACLAGSAFAAVRFPAFHSKPLGLQYAGGSYPDTLFEDVPYISTEFVADLFGQSSRWDPQGQQLHIAGADKREWIFSLDNPFVSVQGTVYNLTYPVRRGPERLYVPLHPLLRLLGSRFDIDLKPAGALGAAGAASMPSGPVPTPAPATPIAVAATGISLKPSAAIAASDPDLVTDMTLEESEGNSILHIRSAPGIKWEGVRTGLHYILRAFDSRLAPDFPRKLRGTAQGAVGTVDALQEGTVAQLTLRIRDTGDSILLQPETGPGTGWQVTVSSNLPPPKSSAGKGTIIVDAGHGGHDFGAIVKGVHEADITLAVSHMLEEELKGMGYTVRLTRPDDIFKTLPERPKFASDNKGDVFVSLHCNSLAGPAERLANVTGYVAYILREGESEEDKTLARRENQAIEQSGKKKAAEISPLDWIVLEHQLNLYSKQSESLAESIIRNFSGFDIPKYSTGARQAGFFVLVGAYMPAVLFEMGFLTNDRDRRILNSPEGQHEIARRMAKAIDAFQRSRS